MWGFALSVEIAHVLGATICFFNLFSLMKIINELIMTSAAPRSVKIFGTSLHMK